MSIAWTEQPWAKEIAKKPILSPVGSAMQIEISRSMAANLCNRFDVPVPEFFHAESKEEAIEIINDNPRPYVLKNPICSPFSPVHTIVCETVEDTLGWIERIDDSEGIFLQEYFGTAEAGHFVFISEGKIQSWSPTRNINAPSREIWGLLREPLWGDCPSRSGRPI